MALKKNDFILGESIRRGDEMKNIGASHHGEHLDANDVVTLPSSRNYQHSKI